MTPFPPDLPGFAKPAPSRLPQPITISGSVGPGSSRSSERTRMAWPLNEQRLLPFGFAKPKQGV
jgi:hypothetical protein